MREKCRDRGRLEHIKTAIDVLMENALDIPRENFLSDKLRYYGIVKNIEIIGEAAYMLSPDLKGSHPEIEWSKISGMRHFLVHDYYNVDPDEIWQVLHEDLADLYDKIIRIIQRESDLCRLTCNTFRVFIEVYCSRSPDSHSTFFGKAHFPGTS